MSALAGATPIRLPQSVTRGAALARRPGLDAQTEQANEALGVLMAEGISRVVGREVVDVETVRLRRPTTSAPPPD